MKVFLSWSGARSEAIANTLREWLPLVVHGVEPWQSNSDIRAGARWAADVAAELEVTSFGVLCVTPENMDSSWVLFEAGALAKSVMDSRVVPLLHEVDFQDLSGPLAAFQAKKTTKSGLHDVVTAINEAKEAPEDPARGDRLFEALWPDLQSRLEALPAASPAPTQVREQPEVLEELVAAVRQLDLHVRTRDEESIEPREPVKRFRWRESDLFDLVFLSDTAGPAGHIAAVSALAGYWSETNPAVAASLSAYLALLMRPDSYPPHLGRQAVELLISRTRPRSSTQAELVSVTERIIRSGLFFEHEDTKK